MEYNFNINGEITGVWYYDDDFHESVTVRTKDKCYDRTIREDQNGKFFTWNKCKVYLNDWIRISLEEFNLMIEKGEHITSDHLCQMLLTEGIENVKVYAPMSSIDMIIPEFNIALCNGSKRETVECKIEEEFLHTIKDNYKLKLVPVDRLHYSSHSFYTSDMISFIKRGDIKFSKEMSK